MLNIEKENVFRIYSGKPNACMCGCVGKYYCTSEVKEVLDTRTATVNDKIVNKILKIFATTQKEVKVTGSNIFTVIENNRQYTIYMK